MNKYSINKTPLSIQQEIAVKHKILRKKAKLSQTELAERSGVSLGSIKRFETTGEISLASLLKSLHVLGRLSDFEKVLTYDDIMENIDKLFSDKTRK